MSFSARRGSQVGWSGAFCVGLSVLELGFGLGADLEEESWAERERPAKQSIAAVWKSRLEEQAVIAREKEASAAKAAETPVLIAARLKPCPDDPSSMMEVGVREEPGRQQGAGPSLRASRGGTRRKRGGARS